MTTKQRRRLEIQSDAIRGFSTWLTSSPGETEEAREFDDQLLYVLQTYREELQRQIAGSATTEDWRNIIAVGAMLARMLKDELIEANPALEEYRPQDEPMTIDEMIMRLLADAIEHFQKCGRPETLTPISDLVQKVGMRSLA